MLEWLRHYRRRRFASQALPASWQAILTLRAPFRSQLDPPMREKLDHAMVIFVAEKNWEGCGGLVLQDEHRVTIAAHALRLTLGFEPDYFDEVDSILVYPSSYEAPSHQMVGSGVVLEGTSARLGESWYRGPVILAWSDIIKGTGKSGRANNVVLHEFAHQLDMRNGRDADGVPVIESSEQAEQWLEVVGHDYQRLCRLCQSGRRCVLDCYGTTNMAEFFAVASESFFETPRELKKEWPNLFAVLKRYYCQEPRPR